MTIHQIECFLEVAHTLNFTEAASRLYISQQGLSRQISALEKELELRLFERTTREVRLTRSGEILLWKWQNIPNLIRESVDMAREDNKRDKERVHVAVIKANGVMPVVGRILADYADRFPQTEFQLKEYSDVKDRAGINTPDLFITLSNGFDYSKLKDKFNWAEIYSYPLYYVFSKKNPMASMERLDSSLLQQQTLLAVFRYEESGLGMKIMEFMGNLGYLPKKVRYFDNADSLELALNANEGIHIGYREYYHDFGDRLAMYPIPTPENQAVAKLMALWRVEDEEKLANLTAYLKTIDQHKKE